MLKQLFLISSLLFSSFLFSQLAITIPTEFEKSEKLLLSWSYNNEIDSTLAEIVGITKKHADVEIVYNPDSLAQDTSYIRSFLISLGSDSTNVSFTAARSNTCMLRQYAPTRGYGVFSDTVERYFGKPGFNNFNRPLDDSMAYSLSNNWSWNIVDYDLQYENSNIFYDGLRYLFVGDRILSDNLPMTENDISFALNSYYNSGIVLFLPNPDQSGGGELSGLSNYLKLIDFETILLSTIPDTLPDYSVLEDIKSELESIVNYFGSPYELFTIPAAPLEDGTFATDKDGINRSYTNSIIINDLVIIPSFNEPLFDSIALDIYKQMMPGYTIRQIDAVHLTNNHCGLNTVTLEIPQKNYLRILHEKITGLQPYSPYVKINCLCQADSQVESMWLYYKINDDTSFTKKEIHLVCPQHFAVIEKLDPGDTVSYYIEAISSKTTTTYPLSAPEGTFTFWLDVVSQLYSNSESYFTISPNPGNGDFKIHSTQNKQSLQLTVFNSNGQKVVSQICNSNSDIKLGNKLLPGIYFIQIQGHNLISKHKLIVQ